MPVVKETGQDVLVLDIRTICPALIGATAQGEVIPGKSTGDFDWEIRLPSTGTRACGCPAGQKTFFVEDHTDGYVQPPFHLVRIECKGCLFLRGGFIKEGTHESLEQGL